MSPEEEQAKQDQHNKEVVKEAIKEATTEWLDARYRDFGRWSFWGLLAFAFTVFVIFAANSSSFKAAIAQALTR